MEANPLNCPELRLNEKYWALVEKYLKTTKESTRTEKEFGKIWAHSTIKVSKDTILSLIEGVPEKVKNFLKTNR